MLGHHPRELVARRWFAHDRADAGFFDGLLATRFEEAGNEHDRKRGADAKQLLGEDLPGGACRR